MPRRKLQTRPHAWPRVVILGLVGIAAAACSDSARFDTYNADRPAPPHNVASSVSGRPASSVHVVQSGDTLMNIARRNGVTLSALAHANKI